MWTICVPGWSAVAVAGTLILYGTLDVAYFARMMYTVAKARYFKKKICILDTTDVQSWCLLNDIDTLLYHMNNARYLRELDFARADFYERSGLYANIKAAGGSVLQAATTIRYRRYLKPFTKFTITSKAIFWDEKTFFMEHEFVGPSGFVHAVALCRQRVIDTSVAAIAELLVTLHCAGGCRHPPEKMTEELELWVQSNEVVQRRDGSRHHRFTHVTHAAAMRQKYAILEHELRLQKSLSEECEDLGVDSPSASELFPEAELLFGNSPAHDAQQHSHTPQPTVLSQCGIPQPDIDDQIATDQLLRHEGLDDQQDLGVTLGLDEGIVTVSEDGMQATIALDQEEFARSHPNTTFHSEPTEDGEIQPFIMAGLKGRHITSTVFHATRAPATVLVSTPPAAAAGPLAGPPAALPAGAPPADPRPSAHAAQVIRRVCWDGRDGRFSVDAGDDSKTTAEDASRDAAPESPPGDDGGSSPERHAELFWESNSTSERSEGRRPPDFSSDSEKCCKSPSCDETNSTDSSGVGAHVRLDSVIKDARGLERSASADGSSDDAPPPVRTYPPKRAHREPEAERSLSGKTRAGERGLRRRPGARGVLKRGCPCCGGEPAPPRPKKPRQRKLADFAAR